MTTSKQLQRIARHTIANRINSKNPAWIKSMTEVMSRPDVLEKISNNSLINWQDENFRARNSASKKKSWANDADRKQRVIEQFSQPKTEEHKKNISVATSNDWATEEGRRKKIEALNKPEVRAKISETHKGVPKKKLECPHCEKTMPLHLVKRYGFLEKHFDNCGKS
jgi:hypothetical protein